MLARRAQAHEVALPARLVVNAKCDVHVVRKHTKTVLDRSDAKERVVVALLIVERSSAR
jgi:hypothetical protein